MTSTEKKIAALLREHRFKLVRQTKHLVYQEPGGRVFVCAATASDWRATENQLTILKRVIANPPQPMSLAISEYEREQAALVIAGVQKPVAVASGMGSGKQRRSNGTGYKYVDNVPTAEQLAQRELLAEQARISRQRKVERQQERRAEKLARRAAAQAEKNRVATAFEHVNGNFLQAVEALANTQYDAIERVGRAFISAKAWRDEFFYEFPTDSDLRAVEDNAHKLFVQSAREFYEDVQNIYKKDRDTLTDEVIGILNGRTPQQAKVDIYASQLEYDSALFERQLASRERDIQDLMRLVRREVAEHNSVFRVIGSLQDKHNQLTSVNFNKKHLYGFVANDLSDGLLDKYADQYGLTPWEIFAAWPVSGGIRCCATRVIECPPEMRTSMGDDIPTEFTEEGTTEWHYMDSWETYNPYEVPIMDEEFPVFDAAKWAGVVKLEAEPAEELTEVAA